MLGDAVRLGATLDAVLDGGELRLLADGAAVLGQVFVTAAEAPFVLAQ